MSQNRPFVHLHVHTHYSLLDGATRIEELVAAAKAMNMPAVGISDHGNMFGVVEFYDACRRGGIKPVIGCELYLATGDRRGRDSSGVKESYHLLLLAKDLAGYRNLIQLSTLAYTEGFYRKPRVDKELLRRFRDGLICTSTCLGGEIPQALVKKDRRAAEELVKTYLEIYGEENFFIELQDHGIEEQRIINPELADIAQRVGVGLIVTNDVHYLRHDDAAAHDVLLCVNTGAKLTDEDRFRFQTDQFYFKTAEQMAAIVPDHPEALDNTLRIAGMCNVELDFGKRHAPVFRVPEEWGEGTKARRLEEGTEARRHEGTKGEKRGTEGQGADGRYLPYLVYEGAKERYGEISDELRQRIDYELEVITGKGFASYFLIVHDFMRYARSQGIPCGARGSGCSSVVAYCLRISAPDPIRYGLYFERFMDPDRDEMPDIDIDICQTHRGRVIDYVREKYGHVAQIVTFNTLKAKAAVKDVARVLGMSFERAGALTKLIPFELKMTIDKALSSEPDLKRLYEADAEVRRIIDVARKIEGLARNSGVHAAGVVVADQPMVNFLPLCKTAGGDVITTQYDGPTVEKVGLLKMDFLGLRTLTVLERARELAVQGTGRDIDLEKIDLADPRVYELFPRGDTIGIFQFESGGMRDVVMRMKPNRIEDLIAANALYRPGPMAYIDAYIARKHGEEWTTPHPIMTEVLAETYGIMVYQEQVSRLVNRLGNIELKAAFRLAKAISKKKTEMIEAMRGPFMAGCEANGVPRATAAQIFDDILKFGGYAFNKAHSTGYALVAFQTAWMKTYFPVEFMAALMTFEMNDTEKIGEYREACRQMGIAVDPPDVNRSEMDFTVVRADRPHRLARSFSPPSRELQLARSSAGNECVDADKNDPTNGDSGRNDTKRRGFAQAEACGSGTRIVFGLGAIKGMGEKAIQSILHARRQGGDFRDLFDFCERVDLATLNRGSIEALICAGAFDRTGAMRKAMCDAVEGAIAAGQGFQLDRRSGQANLFGDDVRVSSGPASPKLSGAEWTEAQMLAREKAVLGFYVTRHPLVSHESLLEACGTCTTAELGRFADGTAVVVGGMISSMRTVIAKSGRRPGSKLGIVTLEDLKGQTEAVVFPDDLDKYRALLAPDAVVFIEGEVDRRREQPGLRTRRVVAVAEALETFGQSVILRLPREEAEGTKGEKKGTEGPRDQGTEENTKARRHEGTKGEKKGTEGEGSGTGDRGGGNGERGTGNGKQVGERGLSNAPMARSQAPDRQTGDNGSSSPAASTFDRVLALLAAHRGPRSAYLEVPTADGHFALIECGRDHRVCCTESLLAEASAMLGAQSVRIVGPRRRPIPWPVERSTV